MEPTRRQFLNLVGVQAVSIASFAQGQARLLVRAETSPSFLRALAERELLRGLRQLFPNFEVRLIDRTTPRHPQDLIFQLRLEPERFSHPEEYSISAT